MKFSIFALSFDEVVSQFRECFQKVEKHRRFAEMLSFANLCISYMYLHGFSKRIFLNEIHVLHVVNKIDKSYHLYSRNYI